ncbi:DUF1643 domain-containing protein [Alistipes communis]|uniref:DUF1643 domain-containing protein n=1 Tax=Alistipes communis TaxID=2585118 RepID=UPI003A8A4151
MIYTPICNETGKSQNDHRFVLEQPGKKMLLVVGLNPSTADETHPDPTTHKVMGFAEGSGYDGFAMLNLSSERATDKRSLSATLDDAMYRKNLDVAADLLQRYPAADILVAFGNDISIRPYLKQSFRDLYSVLRASRGGNGFKSGDLRRKEIPAIRFMPDTTRDWCCSRWKNI